VERTFDFPDSTGQHGVVRLLADHLLVAVDWRQDRFCDSDSCFFVGDEALFRNPHIHPIRRDHEGRPRQQTRIARDPTM
jgi:hypothetical protein